MGTPLLDRSLNWFYAAGISAITERRVVGMARVTDAVTVLVGGDGGHTTHHDAATTGGLHQVVGPTWAAKRPATSHIGVQTCTGTLHLGSAAVGCVREIQMQDHDAAIAQLHRVDPVLARLIDAHPGFDPRAWLKELPSLDAFGALVFQVIGQQLSVAATRRILARLQDLFGGELPTPAALQAARFEDLRRVGLSRRKIDTLHAVAAQFADGSLREEDLRDLSDEEIEVRLTRIPGVGPWTVHGFLIIALDRTDVVLPGDLGLRKALQRIYRFDHLPTPAEALEIAQPWRPYRSLATAYLFASAFGNLN